MSGSAGFAVSYRERPSPLHAARAGATAAFCAAICLAATLHDSPVLLMALAVAAVAAAAAAQVAGELRRAARYAVALVVLVVIVNALVSREGATVILRGGELMGWRIDVTLEAVAYGAVAGLRILVLFLALALFSATVDPDELLRLFRRISYRSALTASLATRLVPVLARDAARMGDAARCRPLPPPRAGAARAALRSALDRAVDVAAALELRGYAGARRPQRERKPWSRHDLAVAASAAAIAAVAVGARVGGVGAFEAYPELAMALGPPEAAVAAALVLSALASFAAPAARLGVARA